MNIFRILKFLPNNLQIKAVISSDQKKKKILYWYFFISLARLNNLTVDFIKTKLIDFRNKAELEYPNYGKFVSHFKNWLLKNKSNPDKIEYILFCPEGRFKFNLTDDELKEKTKTGYWKQQHEIW